MLISLKRILRKHSYAASKDDSKGAVAIKDFAPWPGSPRKDVPCSTLPTADIDPLSLSLAEHSFEFDNRRHTPLVQQTLQLLLHLFRLLVCRRHCARVFHFESPQQKFVGQLEAREVNLQIVSFRPIINQVVCVIRRLLISTIRAFQTLGVSFTSTGPPSHSSLVLRTPRAVI